MNESIYAPPQANMHAKADGDTSPPFYVVSMTKYLVLFLATLGMYKIYWHYKNWALYREWQRSRPNGDDDLWPIPRGIFSIFFTHSLFREVKAYGDMEGRELDWNPDALATGVVILAIVGNVLDRCAAKGIGSPMTDTLALVAMIPLLFLYCKVQPKINASCGDEKGAGNSKFTWANWIWIAIGAIFWTLVVIGLTFPTE
jgi:hypothetical protein